MSPDASATWLPRLAHVVGERLGLAYPRERWPDLERSIRLAARESGERDTGSFALALAESASDDDTQLDLLANALTIGETYFFRERRSFEVIEQDLLPPLIAERRSTSRSLRLWSAGCCTGEEAYSLAIIVDRILPRRQDWQVTILATDINPRFLCTAERGEFGPWSFRDMPPDIVESHFHSAAAHRFAVDARIRRMVKFARLNLCEAAYPHWGNDTQAMDLILCRNVLMYFTPARMQQVLGRFEKTLAEGGWLALSATETPMRGIPSLARVDFGGAVFYRKASQPRLVDARPRPALPGESSQSASAVAILPAMAENPVPGVAPAALPPPGECTGAAADPLRLAREHADAGRLALALESVERAVAANLLDAAAHHLHAVILVELGRDVSAAQALRRALYVEPGFVLAHHALGQVALRQGRRAEGLRHLGNALALLESLPGEDILPRSDGLAVAQLRATITESVARSGGA